MKEFFDKMKVFQAISIVVIILLGYVALLYFGGQR